MMERFCYCCFHFLMLDFYIFAPFVSTTASVNFDQNMLYGFRYISYTNYDGTLATGDCCDEPGRKAGTCSPNLCDTTFEPCGTRNDSSACDVFLAQLSPITFNNNSLDFGKWIGSGINRTASLLPFKIPYSQKQINFTIRALETPEEGETGPLRNIAVFHFVIDWVDPLFQNPPKWKRMILNDIRAQLTIDVVSQCSNHFFTNNCSVYCKAVKDHYTCMDNGTKECLPGWTGTDCMVMVDYCPGNQCQHGSTCVPIFRSYTCTCVTGYTGKFCQTAIPLTSATATTSTTITTTAATTGIDTQSTIILTASTYNKPSPTSPSLSTNSPTTSSTTQLPSTTSTTQPFTSTTQSTTSTIQSTTTNTPPTSPSLSTYPTTSSTTHLPSTSSTTQATTSTTQSTTSTTQATTSTTQATTSPPTTPSPHITNTKPLTTTPKNPRTTTVTSTTSSRISVTSQTPPSYIVTIGNKSKIQSSSKDGEGGNTSMIAGTATGGLCLLCLLAMLVYWLKGRKKQRSRVSPRSQSLVEDNSGMDTPKKLEIIKGDLPIHDGKNSIIPSSPPTQVPTDMRIPQASELEFV